jgi:hypothetical protein
VSPGRPQGLTRVGVVEQGPHDLMNCAGHMGEWERPASCRDKWPGACPHSGYVIWRGIQSTSPKRRASRTSTRPPPLATSAPCPYRWCGLARLFPLRLVPYMRGRSREDAGNGHPCQRRPPARAATRAHFYGSNSLFERGREGSQARGLIRTGFPLVRSMLYHLVTRYNVLLL